MRRIALALPLALGLLAAFASVALAGGKVF